MLDIYRPTAILNESLVKSHIHYMAEKARRNNATFRPHFKTHQSAEIGEWFADEGVNAITCPSLDMAYYFASHGWHDITVAFPANWLEIETINQLAAMIHLGLLVDSVETARFLEENLESDIRVWLGVDSGYHRTGIDWQDTAQAIEIAQIIENSEMMTLSGLLTHAGHSYRPGEKSVATIYKESVQAMKSLRDSLAEAGFSGLKISVGDTPSMSILDDFLGVDEVRPGNFVFYDATQVQLGSCQLSDIAVAVACPVVAKYPEAGRLILYGGAVHLSKDHVQLDDGTVIYGYVALPDEENWAIPDPRYVLASVSQEHGIMYPPADFMEKVNVGDIVLVFPAHSCLTVDMLKSYKTQSGREISMYVPDY
ncbi:D-TA family PLP-dependent enzyme [Anaerolineales bacterium]